MRKLFTMCLAILIAFVSLAQNKQLRLDPSQYDIPVKVDAGINNHPNINMPYNVTQSTKTVALAPQETEVGYTYYDLQSNSTLGNRFYRYADGSIGATWTGGMEATAFPDRGSFYNFWTELNDGSWGWEINPNDVGRIENERAGWPSYAPYGNNGELIVSHNGAGYNLYKRDQAGTGEWDKFSEYVSTKSTWPRVCVNNDVIHVLHYEELTDHGDIYYSRSADNGQTWSPHVETPHLIGSDYYHYLAFSSDRYIWAEPNNGVIAFGIFSNKSDIIIMKSENNGDTWEKIIPWEHPIPFFDYNTQIFDDTICAPTGAASIMIDDDGKCHIAFVVCRYIYTETGGSYTYWPASTCALYWNEDMPNFTDVNNQYDVLYVDRHTEYMDDGRCILAYGFDFDGDGSWYGTNGNEGITYYRTQGVINNISMAQVSLDRLVFAVCATDESVILTPAPYMAKRIYLCSYNFDEIYEEWRFDSSWVTDPDMVSFDLWSETVVEIDNAGWYGMIKGFVHNFDECVYPQILAQKVPAGELGGNFYVFYSIDQTPGEAIIEHARNPQYGIYTENTIVMWAEAMDFSGAKFPEIKPDGVDKYRSENKNLKVYPNPATNMVNISVEETVNCIIYNMAGQAVVKQVLSAGSNTVNISNLKTGVYFISAGNNNAKLIVE
ncbi:MAG: T9SS type A sorting domain-containing protein [Bacteroidales bacterium]|jgi:hypothetical protein|nr:T9SS type A sorting domain-containing protein [Bacteroidales bacterium]